MKGRLTMKKISRINLFLLTSILICSLIAPSFSYAIDDKTQGEIDGKEYGSFLGLQKGEEDKLNNKGYRPYYARPSLKDLLSDENANKIYSLKEQGTTYQNSFYSGFQTAFIEYYKLAYDSTNKGNQKVTNSTKSDYGKSFGELMGTIYGCRDYYEGKSNSWLRSLPSNSAIINEYELNKESSSYTIAFLKDYKDSFKTAYEDSYKKAKLEPKEKTIETGKGDGEFLGSILGSIYGKRDYYSRYSSDWRRHLPSDYQLKSQYQLLKDIDMYSQAFVEGFKSAFEENYNESYRLANVSFNNVIVENGFNDGKQIGLKRGEAFAQMDYSSGLSNDWSRNYVNDTQLINEFSLYRENEGYTEGFVAGFREGFIEGYVKLYQSLNLNDSFTKIETKLIPISGGEITSADKILNLNIGKGTFYNDVLASIDRKSDNGYIFNDKLIKASKVYNAKVSSESKDFNNERLLQLSFEYYGPEKGGIYKYVNGEWLYLPSDISDDRITTFIKPNTIMTQGGTYCVLIDKTAYEFNDIRGHWAKDEIKTYARRNYISGYGGKSFKPDQYITRGEFMSLLSKIYKWDLSENISMGKKFKDHAELKNMEKLAYYSRNKGYINGYSDNTFRVNAPISYRETEVIMRKILGSDNFKWVNVADKMMYTKDVRSKCFDSKDNNITRAETVYMLYLLNEWKN